jgi:hypothetical protein
VELLLNDEEWGQWSDGKIAELCGVSDRFVAKLRPSPNDSEMRTHRKVTRNGATYTMNTSKIGGAKKQEHWTEGEVEPVNHIITTTKPRRR